MRSARSSVARYSLALLATVLALSLRRAFTPLLGNTVPCFTVWSAVAFSAWYCGLGPSIFTAISSALGVWFFFLPPYDSFAIQSPAELSGIVGFLILSGHEREKFLCLAAGDRPSGNKTPRMCLDYQPYLSLGLQAERFAGAGRDMDFETPARIYFRDDHRAFPS
jgi:Domain of unknown function (DUF4118)